MKISKTRLSDENPPAGVELVMPPELTAECLLEADVRDPLNQYRVVVAIKIGDLGFTLREDMEANNPYWAVARFIKAALILGAEHGVEIRDALKGK